MPASVLRCSFPFPPQSPPVEASQACVHCPNADRAILDQHASLKRNDAELQNTIRSFARWFFDATTTEAALDEHVRYAADLYTRDDHEGTCVPKTILFAYYKGLQFAGEYAPRLSENAQAALRGEPVPSWPDGEIRSGPTWNEMFRDYTRRYD